MRSRVGGKFLGVIAMDKTSVQSTRSFRGHEQQSNRSPAPSAVAEWPRSRPDFAHLGWLPRTRVKRVLGDCSMSSANDYRTNAEDCLRMAKQASEERDPPLSATMAQSWLP